MGSEKSKHSICNFELSLLELQGMILDAIIASGSGGACCPTDATEATLQQVLSTVSTEATLSQILVALQNGQEFEQNLIIDSTGATYLQVRIWDTVTHTFGPSVYYDAAGVIVTPVSPLQLVNPQYVLDNILTQVSNLNAKFVSVSRTPTLVRSSTAGFISGGTRSVAVYNAGIANGIFLGAVIKPGERFSYNAGAEDDVLDPISFDGTGTELVITTLV